MQTTTEFHHHVPVPLRKLRVAEAMHPGMIACPPDTPLRSVARMMATYRVHAIVVHAHDEELLPAAPTGVSSRTRPFFGPPSATSTISPRATLRRARFSP